MSTDNRKDLPPVNSANFLEKVREALSVYMGNRGDALDQGLTRRDLEDAGLVGGLMDAKVASGISGIVIPGGPSGPSGVDTEPDLRSPPMPTWRGGLWTNANASDRCVVAGLSGIMVRCDVAAYIVGGGHSKSELWGAKWHAALQPLEGSGLPPVANPPFPTFEGAELLTDFTGVVCGYSTDPSTTWHLWLRWITKWDKPSLPAGGTNGIVVTTGVDVSSILEALTGQIQATHLYNSLGSRIDLIDGVGAGSVAARILSEAEARGAAITAATTNLQTKSVSVSGTTTTVTAALGANASAISTEISDRTTAVSAEAAFRTTLATKVVLDGSNAGISNLTYLQNNYYNISSVDGAISQEATYLRAYTDITTKTFRQTSAPTTRGADPKPPYNSVPLKAGDVWIDSDDGNKPYVYNGTTPYALAGWIASVDNTPKAAFDAWIAGTFTPQIDSKIETWFVNSDPAITNNWDTAGALAHGGDLWYNTTTKQLKRYSGLAWEQIDDAVALAAASAAAAAQTTANSRITTFLKNGAPTVGDPAANAIGDLCIDISTAGKNQMFRWSGTAWIDVRDSSIAAVDARVTNVETAKIGYATLNSDGRLFDGDSSTVVYTTVLYPTVSYPTYNLNRALIIDKNGVLGWNAAHPSNLATWNSGLPLAQAVKQVWISDGANTMALEQRFTAQKTTNGKLLGEYTVKIDNGDSVCGFGLASEPLGESGYQSNFGVRADKFYVCGPTVLGVKQSKFPFIVKTYDEGTLGTPSWKPKGVYIDSAVIENGTIHLAHLGTTDVTSLVSQGDITSDMTISGANMVTGSITSSGTGVYPGSSEAQKHWSVAGTGAAVFNDAWIRGTVWATSGSFTGTIYAGAGGTIGGIEIGATYIQSSNYAYGTTGFRISSDGSMALNNITARGGICGGNHTGSGWPASGGGFTLDSSHLLLGRYFEGASSQYFQVNSTGAMYMPGMSCVDGVLTISALNVINSANIAGHAVTVTSASTGSGSANVSVACGAVGADVLVIATGTYTRNITTPAHLVSTGMGEYDYYPDVLTGTGAVSLNINGSGAVTGTCTDKLTMTSMASFSSQTGTINFYTDGSNSGCTLGTFTIGVFVGKR